jgi:monomeric sarcosine oxidase
MNNYDVVIVGTGIMGSAAAYYLSKAGQKVLLLEQFTLEHQKGSSHDVSRITRYAYDHPAYVELAKVNFPLWAAFEEAAGETFYTKTGGIDFGRPDEPYLRDLQTTLTQTGIPYETLTPAEARERFPPFHIPEDMIVVYQAESGVLAATPAVLAHIRLAQQHGATVLAETAVTRIVPTGDGVTVHTPKGNYSAARVIISAGAWTAPLMAELGLSLPLVPTRVQVAYFHTAKPADYAPERFPVFIAHVAGTFTEHAPYGLPENWHSRR